MTTNWPPTPAIRLPSFRIAGSLFLAGALILLILSVRRFGSAYLAERLGVLLATLLAATAIVFVIVQVVPGDPVRYMMGLQSRARHGGGHASAARIGRGAMAALRLHGSADCCMRISV